MVKSFPCACGLRRSLLTLCAAWSLAGAPAVAGPPPWPDAPYSYFTEGTPLESVLAEFAGSFSLSLSLAPGVTGAVNGRFTTRNPTEFISRLGGVYGFSWYTQGGTLHVSKSSDAVIRTVPMPAGGMGNLRQSLTDLGVVEPRFGWGELPDQGVVMLSGPPSYVSMLETTLRQLPSSASAQQVTVFRLRHAAAEDRVIQYRDREITQPGLATVLRQLVLAGSAGAGGGVVDEKLTTQPATAAAAPVLGGLGMGEGAAPARGASPAPAPSRSAGGSAASSASVRVSGSATARVPSIQSDPRLNAIIVQDIPERMSLYERLIAQLDVPSSLIEIEAMIIDINTERAREMGINWSMRAGGFTAGFGAVQPPQNGTLTIGQASGLGSISPSTLVVDAGNYLLGQIRLLENSGDARIQSRPSVLTTDNVGALLDLSETFYIRVQGERVATVSPITAGTTLKVTPRLVDGPEPSIQLTIDIEDGQIQDRQIDSLPTVRRSSVSTQAVVRQNEMLMIAGYSSDQNIDTVQKVPGLGDLPVVGALFANKARTVQKRERLFLIKPKLVSQAASQAAGAAPAAPAAPAAVP